ncbi:hypothetical protein ACWEOG_33670, partial [Amycolatopsis japonica]
LIAAGGFAAVTLGQHFSRLKRGLVTQPTPVVRPANYRIQRTKRVKWKGRSTVARATTVPRPGLADHHGRPARPALTVFDHA